jgi:hypothetical protein
MLAWVEGGRVDRRGRKLGLVRVEGVGEENGAVIMYRRVRGAWGW